MKRLWITLSAYASWRVWLLLAATIAASCIPFVPTFTPLSNHGVNLPRLAWIWGNFDGVVFMNIAQHGYTASEVPFFPLYPLTMHMLHALGLPILVAGLLISFLSFLGALVFLYKTLQQEKQGGLYLLVLFLMLSFPTAYHYASVYSDSLFLLLASGTLYFTRGKRYFWAGVFGAFATLCRLNGLALAALMALQYLFEGASLTEAWDWRQWPRRFWKALSPERIWKSGILWGVLIPLAFLGYLGFIESKFGSWQLFFSGVEVWHRNKMVFPLQTFWRYVKILFFSPRITFTYWIAVGEAVMTALYCAVLFFSWKRIHPTLWGMMFFHWLIPVVTGTLQGMPRYGLHMVPLFLCLALFLEKKPWWMKVLYFAVSLALQTAYLAFFTRGYFVS